MDSCWDQGERDVTMPPGSKEVPKIPSSGGMKQITLSSELPTVTSPNCSGCRMWLMEERKRRQIIKARTFGKYLDIDSGQRKKKGLSS
ncbi:uncharacterized protein [Anas platyrhynchos]|uniref:uncharacterized protein isoform X7 n=1 Tax=Anas platyrhynchos TaxID=8839 RepID=UPI003AF24A78